MSPSILVTAATGKVGKQLIHELSSVPGVTVKAAVRDASKAAPGAATVRFDFDDAATWTPAFAGIDALFLVTPPWHPREVEIGKAVITAAIQAGVKRIVKLSAMGAENVDAFAHKAVDAFLAGAGVEYTVLKPTFFAQNFSEMHAATIRATGSFFLAAADGKTCFIDTRDIAAVAAKALLEPGHHGKTYEITGPRALDHHEVAAILSAASGRTITYVPVSPEQAEAGMRQAGFPDAGVQGLLLLMSFVRAGYTAHPTTTVRDVLGREPIAFERYAADHADAFRG